MGENLKVVLNGLKLKDARYDRQTQRCLGGLDTPHTPISPRGKWNPQNLLTMQAYLPFAKATNSKKKKKKRQSCTQSLTVLPNLGPTWIRNVADCNTVGKEAFIQNFLDIKLPVTVQPSQVPNTSLLQPNSNENLCNESSTTQFFTYCSRFAIKY